MLLKPTNAFRTWQVLAAARIAGIRVFYALHHRYVQATTRPGSTCADPQPPGRAGFSKTGRGAARSAANSRPAWEIVAQEHWCPVVANTDLDLQLKKHGIHKLVVMGLIAHTCVEATVRYAAELGYEVTVVKDATASYSDKHMQAALEVNIPNYASAVVTTREIVAAISAL
jgi:nicotinamidase-related amidase